ncbi:uncharacterized protein LOC116160680 isoform X2 [Photinus pyralis]|nr:uncharacterized protein LOC116160680 isoform X2 [Photinus pyralis]
MSCNIHFLYGVIEFSLNDTIYVSSCPLSWVTGDECKWPAKKGIERKAIANQMAPEKDWITLKNISILGRYETYKEALYSEKKKTLTSDESDENTNMKRKSKKNSKYKDDSISPPPKHDSDRDDSTSSYHSDHSLENPNFVEENSESQHYMTNNEVSIEQLIDKADITIISQRNCDDLWSVVMEMKVQLNLVLERLVNIEKMLAEGGSFGICTSNANNNNLPNLPLSTMMEFQELEEKLVNDERMQNSLLHFLKFIGGNDSKSCTYRCIGKMFTNYLGQFFSWSGKGGNVRLADTQTINVIKRAAKSTFPDLSDHFFEVCVRAWFNHSKTRYNREKQNGGNNN